MRKKKLLCCGLMVGLLSSGLVFNNVVIPVSAETLNAMNEVDHYDEENDSLYVKEIEALTNILDNDTISIEEKANSDGIMLAASPYYNTVNYNAFELAAGKAGGLYDYIYYKESGEVLVKLSPNKNCNVAVALVDANTSNILSYNQGYCDANTLNTFHLDLNAGITAYTVVYNIESSKTVKYSNVSVGYWVC